MVIHRFSFYFADLSRRKYLFYSLTLIFVIGTSIAVVVEPFLSLPCDEDSNPKTELEYENALYHYLPCSEARYPLLFFLTPYECQHGRHLLMAVFLGSLIGYERRSGDRPAGIRTMALVSLGSALFTINSTFGFLSGPMSWDASRVSAAIPSGVGFLGAGLIVKSSEVDPVTGERHHFVQGITTAAATWLSAAVGIACGGGMYFVASFSTALNIFLLRFGPRAAGSDDIPSASLDIEAEEKPTSYGGTDEISPRPKLPTMNGTIRNRPSLGVN